MGATGLPDRWETERLLVRPWTHDDAERVLDIHSRLEVVRWLGDGPPRPMTEIAEAHSAIPHWVARAASPPHGTWAVEVRASGVVAGSVTLAVLPRAEHGETELAWWLHPDSWAALPAAQPGTPRRALVNLPGLTGTHAHSPGATAEWA